MTPPASVLVVEDEFLVAMQIEAVLRGAGWSVIGPAGTLAKAVSIAQTATCDGAVLDVNLRGERVDDVADYSFRARYPVRVCIGLWAGKSAGRLSGQRSIPCKAV